MQGGHCGYSFDRFSSSDESFRLLSSCRLISDFSPLRGELSPSLLLSDCDKASSPKLWFKPPLRLDAGDAAARNLEQNESRSTQKATTYKPVAHEAGVVNSAHADDGRLNIARKLFSSSEILDGSRLGIRGSSSLKRLPLVFRISLKLQRNFSIVPLLQSTKAHNSKPTQSTLILTNVAYLSTC